MIRIWLLAPLCAAVLVKSPSGDTVGDVIGRNPTYRLWGKVYNASYVAPDHGEDLQSDESDELEPTEPQSDDPGEDAPQVQDTQVECVDAEPMVWKAMVNCLRKRRFISCMSGFISRHWRRVATATGRKKALRRFYLPLLLLFFKFKLLVVVLGMVAALAGKSAIMSVVSLAVAAGVAIKTSLGVHDIHNNKRFDADLGGQTSTGGGAINNNNGGYYVK